MYPQARGFSAIELLVVLAITGLLIAMAVPSMREHLQNQQMRAALVALQASLLLARNRAVHSRQAAVVCPGNPELGCGTGEQWSQGWWAFADPNGDRAWQAGEPLLQQAGPAEGVRISSSSARTRLRFQPNGTAPGSNATLQFCDSRGPRAGRQLKISNSGRVMRLGPGGDAGAGCAAGN